MYGAYYIHTLAWKQVSLDHTYLPIVLLTAVATRTYLSNNCMDLDIYISTSVHKLRISIAPPPPTWGNYLSTISYLSHDVPDLTYLGNIYICTYLCSCVLSSLRPRGVLGDTHIYCPLPGLWWLCLSTSVISCESTPLRSSGWLINSSRAPRGSTSLG